MREEWRLVLVDDFRWPYEVSDRGRVRRIIGKGNPHGLRLLRTPVTSHGYPKVDLFGGGKRKTVAVHRLVAGVFLGQCPTGHDVNHRDCNKTNNHVSNLEYVTRSENAKHAYKNGLIVPPTRGGFKKKRPTVVLKQLSLF